MNYYLFFSILYYNSHGYEQKILISIFLKDIQVIFQKNYQHIYYFHQKNFKMQRAEKLCNLLECILIKATWRNERIEYDII